MNFKYDTPLSRIRNQQKWIFYIFILKKSFFADFNYRNNIVVDDIKKYIPKTYDVLLGLF